MNYNLTTQPENFNLIPFGDVECQFKSKIDGRERINK